MLNLAKSVDLSAVIVNWNGGADLALLLDSLQPLREELREVLVVDNGSADDSAAIVSRSPGVAWVPLQENRGFSVAANRGIAQAASSFVLLLNPDIRIVPDSVRRLYAGILSQKDAAVACGALQGEDGKPQAAFQIRPLPTVWSVLRDVLFLDEVQEWLGSFRRRQQCGEHRPDPAALEFQEVEQPAAAFWLLRKEAWESVGGFDESFAPAWFEDVDLCRRLREGGWRLLYFPGLFVYHRGGAALERLGYQSFLSIYYANLLRYLKKHHPYSFPFLWVPVRAGLWLRRKWVRR